ncbi:DNA repair protein XRCC1-like isoform X2 [Clavelina lepadiformis]|uniref:DNA repair protein XRCC1-like isoform X2 n=1 Tax=Clavelina lepadiformis TaxID=159417 RepID=UPI004042A871
MPVVKLKHIVSFSSEDKVHRAENLIKGNSGGKWKCEKPGEKQISVIIQLEKSVEISSLDIGNDGAAFVEVLVGRSSGNENFHVLLVASSFMTPQESRKGSGCNRVRMFDSSKLSPEVSKQKWDLVKIVCTQPFNKHTTYGLTFINFHTTEKSELSETKDEVKSESTEDAAETNRITFGAFKLKKEVDVKLPSARPGAHDEDSIKTKLQNLKRKNEATGSSFPPKKTKPAVETDDLVGKEPLKRSSLESRKSESSSDKSATPTTPSRKTPAKSPKKKFNEILRNVVFVISGFQNPKRREVRDTALSMGATYKGDWDPTCTHLVCAFRNTPKYQQVRLTGNGHIVNADWFKECAKAKRRLPLTSYNMNSDDNSDSEENDPDLEQPVKRKDEDDSYNPYDESTDDDNTDDDSDTEDEIERIKMKQEKAKNDDDPAKKRDPYGESTDEEGGNEDESEDLPPLPDYFSGKHFFLYGQMEPEMERMLRRHIIACDGSIAPYMSDEVRYVVSESDWQETFDDALADNSSLVFIRPAWVFKCGQAKKLLPHQPFAILTN